MIISQTYADSQRAATDKQYVRLILHDVSNSGQYRLRGRKFDYVFTYDNAVARHILDIPLSLWQANAQAATTHASWRDNVSVAEDVRAHTTARLSFYVLDYFPEPYTATPAEITAKPTNRHEKFMERLGKLFDVYGAPSDIIDFCELYTTPATEEELDTFVFNLLANARALTTDEAPELPESVDSETESAPSPKKRGRKPREVQPEGSTDDLV